MRLARPTFALVAVLLSSIAFAQSPKSSNDIIKFFANAVDLGAKRGICVGTEDECKSKAIEPEKTGLDMLINFDLNSSDLTPDARAKLTEFATALQDNRLKSHSFAVEGYTDASGSERYNETLSQRRAQSVTAFLLGNGIEASRLKAVGNGEKDPRVPNAYDPANRQGRDADQAAIGLYGLPK